VLQIFISEVFRFEILGFEQVDEGFYKVYFRDVEIGEFDAEMLRFLPVQVMRRMDRRLSQAKMRTVLIVIADVLGLAFSHPKAFRDAIWVYALLYRAPGSAGSLLVQN
jgi:hypothetical protein